jgi:hypothetical protein
MIKEEKIMRAGLPPILKSLLFYILFHTRPIKLEFLVTTASLIVKKGSIYRPRERKKYVIRK